jgi:two-component system, cell cycle sensor histidine kinase and response regulator CckA
LSRSLTISGAPILRLLLCEDQENDAVLLLSELERLGYTVEFTRVDTGPAMAAALAEPWDLIISDFAMPQFGAYAALALCREKGVDVPFIIVSGTIEEEEAVEAMRLGADDFITKGRLARLGPAIVRSRREYEERLARRAAEARLRQAQKMEAIGQLAGGVAHDFNNLLGVIQGYGELMVKELATHERHGRRLEQILRAADRGAALTRQLLALSRHRPFETRPIDLNAVVTELDPMLRRLISEDIQITTVLEDGLHRVKADPNQMEQVLMNLAINARDAMATGGRLTIETRNVDLDAHYVLAHPDARPGPHACLAVEDTGHGIDPETLARVFEPFFTTKEPGKGTGLGLATVYGIVRQNGGHVSLESAVGKGTRLTVYLPSTAEAQPAAAAEPGPEPRRQGSETVLLVEDDPALRLVIREALQVEGYTVVDGDDPAAALAAAAAHPQPIHLMITDLVMPHLTGREAAERVRAARPAIKVIYMSGYSSALPEPLGGLPDGSAFLQKPFSLDALLRKLREALDAPA